MPVFLLRQHLWFGISPDDFKRSLLDDSATAGAHIEVGSVGILRGFNFIPGLVTGVKAVAVRPVAAHANPCVVIA